MRNVHMERSAGYSGIAFVLAVIANVAVIGFPPSTAPAAVLTYYVAHQNGVLVGSWLGLVASGFILWFASGLNDFLRDPDGREATLLRWGFAGVLLGNALVVFGDAAQILMVYHPIAAALGSSLSDAANVLPAMAGMPFAWWIWAVCNSARRQGRWPAWLIWLGFLAAALQAAVSLVGLFPAAPLLFVFGQGIVTLLWVLLASILLIRTPEVSS